MEREELKQLIDVSAGRRKAELVIKNGVIADVYSGKFIRKNIAISHGVIVGLGNYEGKQEINAEGKYVLPGFIDGHIHVESSYVSPHELGRILVPHGGTTIIADPHEIVNVCGLDGFDYMKNAAKNTELDIKYMMSSCVPATPFEHSGAIITAKEMEQPLCDNEVLGLGEFMNYPGVIQGDNEVLDKILVAKEKGKIIDGHSPALTGKDLNAYAFAGIRTDHECDTVEELEERIERGVYVLLRQGSACHNLRALAKGVTKENARRCLLCSDDRQPKTILEQGHIDCLLRMCVEEGIDAMTAIQMATINAAECYKLEDRGAISPGKRADIVLVDDVEKFHVSKVWIQGKLVAQDGKYLLKTVPYPIDTVKGRMYVKGFSKERLKLHLNGNQATVIDIMPGGVVTKKSVETVTRDQDGNFVFDKTKDIVKVAVIERHHNTGNMAVALLGKYGMKQGAIALSVAHDSHNIIVVGVNDEDMTVAVERLISIGGGIVLAKNGEVLDDMAFPIAGLMSDQSGEWVNKKLSVLHEKAYEELEIHHNVEPIMTLCFMSLPVIPEIKITDMGLFDVTKFQFIPVDAKEEKNLTKWSKNI